VRPDKCGAKGKAARVAPLTQRLLVGGGRVFFYWRASSRTMP